MLAGLSAGLTAGVVTGASGEAAAAVPGRQVILVGANPGVSLFDGDRLTAFASVWDVRWSTRGSGRAIVLWHADRVRVLATETALGEWLSQYFTRNFPEVAGVPWPEPAIERADVTARLDLATGLHARARDVSVRLDGVLHRRTFSTDEFELAGVPHSLSLVLAPAREARITVRGRALPGTVVLGGTPERPSSSAFLTEAEVWSA
ncbi:hypothetical protein [Phytohabitans aurantiacus]|jgi:hypothetical protein|uniref:Uncharacterized protein n=1 Tax=Phytohabitans aurantiacus TaxID=3016789 RepID=A0ABQ5R8K7_9ACTN|nr:hypothetical protein [Phytohabitans aurantiacus]GLI02300.1 hypothetical protein Pa4123_75780 [Phytohabitans aurantiacus]